MIRSFKNAGTEDLFNGIRSKVACRTCPPEVWDVAARKLDQLDSAGELIDLSVPPGNRLEALKGNRIGQHSIRINAKFRICFIWTASGPAEVEIVDYH